VSVASTRSTIKHQTTPRFSGLPRIRLRNNMRMEHGSPVSYSSKSVKRESQDRLRIENRTLIHWSRIHVRTMPSFANLRAEVTARVGM